MLTATQIEKFQALYEKRFGKTISKEAALEQGAKLVRLMEIIYRPMTKEEYEAIQKRRKEKGWIIDDHGTPPMRHRYHPQRIELCLSYVVSPSPTI